MLKRLLLGEVVVGRSRRTPLKGRIASVARSMREIGQLHPITVNADDNRLIAGLTRLEAAKLLDWKDILASVVDFNKLQAELAEIDENIERSNLTALEEAQALARRKAIYEELYPETQAGVVGGTASGEVRSHQRTDANLAVVQPGFTEATAASTGRSERSIQRSVRLAENIAPQAAAAIKRTPIADNQSQLERLSRLPVDQQVEVAQAIKSGEAATVQEASKQVAKETEDGKADDPSLEDVMKAENSEIESFCRRLVAFAEAEMPAKQAWVKHNGRGDQAMQKIKDACTTLRSCKCTQACPRCDGSGCARCLRTGRVTKYIADQLSATKAG